MKTTYFTTTTIITALLTTFFIKAQSPNWSVNSANYTLDASLIAIVNIDGNISSDSNDKVAIFDENNSVRGVANIKYDINFKKHLLYLTYFSNQSNEKLTLKVYDASVNKIIDASNVKIKFNPFSVSGSNEEPYEVVVENAKTPKVATVSATSVTSNSAILGGEIISQGVSEITQKGILYSTTNPSPRVSDKTGVTKVVDSNPNKISQTINGLNTLRTIYYFRAFATNSQGTAYGKVYRFTLNNALNFKQSNNDFVRIPHNALFDFSNGLTIEAWVKPTSFKNNPTLFSQIENNQKAFFSSINADGSIKNTISTSGENEVFYSTKKKLTLNTWQHVAFTFNGTEMKCYINGSDAKINGSISGTIGNLFNSNAPIEIGAKNEVQNFQGDIDEIRIWKRALTKIQINTNKNKNIPPNVTTLLAYYTCNQGIAKGNNTPETNLIDASSNNINAQLINFNKTGKTSNFVLGANGNDGQTEFAINQFTTSGNWSNINNWSQGFIPSNLQNVRIANGVTITIDIDDIKVNNFILEDGATINIPKNKELIVFGRFTSNGFLDISSDENTSGVLMVKGTTYGNITYKRGGLIANKWSIVTPPVSGQKIKSFAIEPTNEIRQNTTVNPVRYAIGYYDDSQPTSKWQYYNANINANQEFNAGQSYAISRATDGEVMFTGKLTINNLFKTLIADQWNAIGNPFTTYYPANKNGGSSFLNDNFDALDNAYKSLYVWSNDQNKYVPASEVSSNTRSLPPGQGFFIRLKVGKTAIQFKEDKRSTKPLSGSTEFEKNSTPSITVKLSNKNTTVTTDIKYFANVSKDLDPGYDIGNHNGASFDVFTKLLQSSNTDDFAIQSLPIDNYEQMVIPIGVKANKDEEITITASYKNLPISMRVYLEDRKTNTFTELGTATRSYTMQLSENLKGVGRLYLHTTNKALSTATAKLTGVEVFLDNNLLRITGLSNDKVHIKMYSVLGKEVLQYSFMAQNNEEIILPKLAKGVYVVNLQTVKGLHSEKVILK